MARKDQFALLLTTLLVLILNISITVTSQCCCSREGPCRGSSSGDGNNDEAVSLEGTFTPDFVNSILSQARDNCAVKGFYFHDGFIAVDFSFPNIGSCIYKREVAAFFAHDTHETEFMCYIEEIYGPAKADDYCDKDNTDFPCAQGKGYYGRGPIQLSWNYNYSLCGNDLNENLLASPEKVAQDPILAFKTAFWFWTTNVHKNFNQGFGTTIRAVNGMECSGRDPQTVEKRIGYFRDYCAKLGFEPGDNLSC